MYCDDNDLKNEINLLKQRITQMELALQDKNQEIEAIRRENQNSLESIAEMIPAAIHVLKGDKFSYINSTFASISGYSKEESLNLNYIDIVHPDFQEMVKKKVIARRHNNNLPNARYDLKIITKDGSEVWLDHSAGQITLDGEAAIIAVLYDISERKAVEEKILEQNALLQETHAKLEEMYSELQISQYSLMEINAKLRESEERLELALWATNQGLWDLDLETGYFYFTNQWANILGYEANELKPHLETWIDRIHPTDYNMILENLNLLNSAQTDFESEYRVRNNYGKWIWVIDRGRVVTWTAVGKPKRVVGTRRDISLKKIMEKALRQSENRYRTLVDAVPEIIAHLNQFGNFIWVNEMGSQFFGEDICGRHFSESFYSSAEYHQTAYKLIPLIKDYDETIQLETLLKRHDGQIRLLKWQCKTLNENGNTIGTLATAQDITEIRAAEIQLQESEKRYRDLFEKSPIGLLKVDLEGNILDINQYYLDMVNAPSKDELPTSNLFEIAGYIPQFAAVIDEHLHNFINGKPVFTEVQFTSSWGKKVWVRYKADPVFNADGKVTEAIVACEEITALKQAEAQINYLSYNDALTCVYNRAFFDAELKRLNTPRQLPLSIIIGDVNGLKLVNDAFGHLAGDKLLKTISQILKDSCREEDIIARWGGDEFAILLPKTPQAVAYKICERISSACQSYESNPILPSIALGVATKETASEDINKIMSAAEDIMYRNKLLESKSIRNSIISSLETSLHEKTFETREHAQRLQKLCLRFGKALGLPANELDTLSILANLHDIGKIGIPDSILSKPGPLTSEEWEIIKKHPEIGYRIVYSSHELLAVADEVLAHHEKWDGSGYPDGLKGTEIPILSRILAIVDAYDVMTHERAYKKAISHDDALEEIKKCASSHFDPDLVKVFLDIF